MRNIKTSNLTLIWRKAETAAGDVAVAYTGRGLYALELPGYYSGSCKSVGNTDPQWLQRLADELKAYFSSMRVEFSCPIDDADYPPFIRQVLQITAGIPYGECRTYRWLAHEAGSPLAVRAAGQAMARNRTPVVVPCHRVLRSDGTLGGFGYGLSWKKRLLDLESAAGEE